MSTTTEIAEKFKTRLTVIDNAITLSKNDYSDVIGADECTALQDAHARQMTIDRAIALAAAEVGYAHMKDNKDVSSIPVTINQYSAKSSSGAPARSLSAVISRETKNPMTGSTKAGGIRVNVVTKIKGSEFTTQAAALATKYFG